jgi:malate dehydrogenase (oxaloacetate-decarboxylating)
MLHFNMIRNKKGNIEKIEVPITGGDLLSAPKLNKGSAFSAKERDTFKLRGKLPEREETLAEQAKRFYQQYLEQNSDLEKNIFLNNLHGNNETLFYKLINEHLDEMLPIVYTPTVGEAVQKFSHELRHTRGLFISYPDIDRIPEILKHRLNPDVDIILATDGEGVLGIGDQGVGGMDIAIGKLIVYTLCGGVNPHRMLPVQLDVGTNNKALLDDPMYLGWRHERISGKQYDEFIEAFVSAVQKEFPWVFLHWEDFGRENARRNLNHYRKKICSFNDDIQGTGATALACVLSGVQATGKKMNEQRVIVFGGGTAGCGVADQICAAMQREGMSEDEARANFWIIDRNGLIIDDMKDLVNFQEPYARKRDELSSWQVNDASNISLLDVVSNIKPTILIGCSTVKGAFSEEVVKTMAGHVDQPIIFPMSNPTSKAEATPADLLNWTNGKAIVATGSPFDPVELNGKKIRISQSNNAFTFPGLGLGVIAAKTKAVTDNMIWAAASALRDQSPAKNDISAPLLPDIEDSKEVAHHIAKAVVQAAIDDGVAEPIDDIELAIRSVAWEPAYYSYDYKP